MTFSIPVFPKEFVQRGAFEFHISRRAREQYQFDEAIFQLQGNAILADFQAARRFVQKINQQRDLAAQPELAVRAGQINAVGLIDEIMHLILAQYKQRVNPELMGDTLAWLENRLGAPVLDMALLQFADQFPPLLVFRREQSVKAYYGGETGGIPNREIVLEELLMLSLANANPAVKPFQELFDDRQLRGQTAYVKIIEELEGFFYRQPAFGPQNQPVIEMLRSPGVAQPHSLAGQVEYIRDGWGAQLGGYLIRLISNLDLIKEEEKPFFGFGPGPVEPYDFDTLGAADAPERFSPDQDWMPKLVLIAKNTPVWLDQLSKKYRRDISRLDHIPDEELDILARRGISGLWLVGLWQRSEASRQIKHMMGNPDAVASAYALDDYRIADDLGGGAAADDLRRRTWQRGIRMACDMVPNHMGIDSRWVLDHPDWFLGMETSPFPSYTFEGGNLSRRDWTGIYLEDHYYDRSDAAVVFKYVDYKTGQERYIYHGNDGTGMPWNDTAQLDFTKPEVREAVIQTILKVARQFPIIRFDAAMVLAKQHIQRLWFPAPGSGGAIPSRTEFGISEGAFDQLIPEEFWREVVDRVTVEAPNTLLLAEAFWMMEGYFVRTLGMHRVYNSAFMHMLRDEDNAKYRQLIKNTLGYNPEILKRYLNFMTNPDEEAAAVQFGKGDKYFGVATMLATMPGLPMAGHGQIEGFTEKYGMEYNRAKLEEQPDEGLIDRHKRQIFPLFHRRAQFAEVENFLLYDFYTQSGTVNEDVFAYSNRLDEDRALMLYHNKFGDTRGWVKTSAAYSVPEGEDGERTLVQKSLAAGLALPDDPAAWVVFRELVSNQEFIRNCCEIHEKGLFAELTAYQTLVFLDFRIVMDAEGGAYRRLASHLNGSGVADIDEALQELAFAPVLHPYRELINAGMFGYLIEHQLTGKRVRVSREALRQAAEKSAALLTAAAEAAGREFAVEKEAKHTRLLVEKLLQMPVLSELYPLPKSRNYQALNRWLNGSLGQDTFTWGVMLGWALTQGLGAAAGDIETARGWVDEWLLRNPLEEAFTGLGADQGRAAYGVRLVRLLLSHSGWYRVSIGKRKKPLAVLTKWLADPAVRDILGVNRFEGVEWFNLEAMEEWLWWMMATAAVQILADIKIRKDEKAAALLEAYGVVNKMRRTISGSECRLDKFIEILEPGK